MATESERDWHDKAGFEVQSIGPPLHERSGSLPGTIGQKNRRVQAGAHHGGSPESARDGCRDAECFKAKAWTGREIHIHRPGLPGPMPKPLTGDGADVAFVALAPEPRRVKDLCAAPRHYVMDFLGPRRNAYITASFPFCRSFVMSAAGRIRNTDIPSRHPSWPALQPLGAQGGGISSRDGEPAHPWASANPIGPASIPQVSRSSYFRPGHVPLQRFRKRNRSGFPRPTTNPASAFDFCAHSARQRQHGQSVWVDRVAFSKHHQDHPAGDSDPVDRNSRCRAFLPLLYTDDRQRSCDGTTGSRELEFTLDHNPSAEQVAEVRCGIERIERAVRA